MIIYKTTNLINGNFYIGQDSKNNPEYLGSGLLLNKALKKYGRDNFLKEIIEQCNSKEQLNLREIFWISELKPLYNIAKGGNGGDTYSNHPDYDLIIEKLKLRPVSWPKGKKRISTTGDNNPAKRLDVREKISKFRLENPIQMFGDNNPSRRPEVREKIRVKLKDIPKEKFECPYCNKIIGGRSNFERWHNDNCKFKNK
jgi:group I intron endonuclease